MATQLCRVGYNVLRRTLYSNIRAGSTLAGPHKAPDVPDRMYFVYKNGVFANLKPKYTVKHIYLIHIAGEVLEGKCGLFLKSWLFRASSKSRRHRCIF